MRVKHVYKLSSIRVQILRLKSAKINALLQLLDALLQKAL